VGLPVTDLGAGADTAVVSAGIAGTETDNFNRPDSATTLGVFSQDSTKVWTPQLNTWGISGNAAYITTSANGRATVPGSADGSVGVTLATWGSPQQAYVMFRYSDANNYWRFGCTSTQYKLQKVVAGVVTSTYTSSVNTAQGDIISVSYVGSTINCYVNGVGIGASVDAFNSSATIVGLQLASTTTRLDNFTFADYTGAFYDTAAGAESGTVIIHAADTGAGVETAVVNAQVPGADTASGTDGVMGSPFDVSQIQPGVNATTYQSITTYVGGDNSVVEPSVLYFANGWNGYKYWMVAGPYTNTDATVENPSIWASSDGTAWVVPTGGSNPVVPYPGASHGNNCDPQIFMSPDSLTMYLTWSEDNNGFAPPGDGVYMISSTDGITWSARTLLIRGTTSSYHEFIATRFVWDGTTWHMFALNNSTYAYKHYTAVTATSLTGGWNTPTTCTIAVPPVLGATRTWEADIAWLEGRFLAIVNFQGNNGIGRGVWWAESNDGNTWTVASNPFLVNRVGLWDNGIYKAGFVQYPNAQQVDLWYSSANFGSTNPDQWHIGRVPVQISLTNIAATVPGADTGSGADTAFVSVVLVPGADTGAGIEGQGIATLGSDTASGADTAVVIAQVPAADTGLGLEGTPNVTPLGAVDSGAGVDAAAVTNAVQVADTGLGVENATIGNQSADTGAGSDTAAVSAQIPAVDAGSGADSATIGVRGAVDVGSGADSAIIATSAADTGSGAESANLGDISVDSGSGAEAAAISAQVPAAETGFGVDVAIVIVQASDSATGVDNAPGLLILVADSYIATEGANLGVIIRDADTWSGYEFAIQVGLATNDRVTTVFREVRTTVAAADASILA
jgi:hypothetical protein